MVGWDRRSEPAGGRSAPVEDDAMRIVLWRAAFAAGMTLGLAGCNGAVVNTPFTGTYDGGQLSYVAAKGDLRTDVVGNPFGVPQETVDRAVTAAMFRAHPGPPIRFSTEANADNPSPYRVVVVLNPAPQVAEGTVCATANAAERPSGDTLRVVAAFCAGAQRETSVSGWLDNASGPNDPAFVALIRQMTGQLFPPRNTDPNGGADFNS